MASMATASLFPFLILLLFLKQCCLEDSCRILKFIQHEQNTALEHHVIHTSPVDDDDQCQLQCYLQEKCLSYNLGTQGPGSQLVCELSDSDHYQHPGHLVFKEGFWYQPALRLCGDLSCPPAASCVATIHGIFRCVCPAHWPNLGNCERDHDECTATGVSNDCSADAYCNNTVGSYTCTCKKGFAGDGRICQNVNECTTGIHNCHVNTTCTDTQGSYNCTCNADSIGNGTLCLGFPFHWTLNGSDPFVRLYNGASYETVDGKEALYLDGSHSYAETPAIPIQTISFSILCWTKVLSLPHASVNIYSDWSAPHQFRIAIIGESLCVNLRGKNATKIVNIVYFCGRTITIGEWVHVAFTWNRNDRTGRIYINGVKTGKQTAHPSKGTDLNPTGHTVFDIGLKRDSKRALHGYLRDLLVINQAISDEEVDGIFFQRSTMKVK